MFGLGFWELIIIVFVILLVFGAGRLPELGTALGEGIKNFRKGYRDSKALDASPASDEPEQKS
ncbi:MAG TPA: twin-arginine translocase TatA/TatE family subunit [Oligoflexia bacterium]|nr:twin-arginine translocase TatA/TatE family subunit [Oligoflexia bacterium]